MKLASAHRVGGARKLLTGKQAQVRVAILPLISFLLGIVVTVLWFQFGPNHQVEKTNLSLENTRPAAEQPVEPAITPNRPSRPFVPSHPPVDSTTLEAVKQAIPNYASVSLADGIQTLREAALKQFTAMTKEMDAQVQQAQQQLIQAEKSQSATEQQAARKHLQDTQAAAAEKIQQIAAELQTRIAALKQLKGTTQ
jgi:hypothetical protein